MLPFFWSLIIFRECPPRLMLTVAVLTTSVMAISFLQIRKWDQRNEGITIGHTAHRGQGMGMGIKSMEHSPCCLPSWKPALVFTGLLGVKEKAESGGQACRCTMGRDKEQVSHHKIGYSPMP